jgi:hypothetical protein
VVGGHDYDHRRLRRPLPGDCSRTPGGLRADDWRDRPARHVTATLASWLVETVAAEKDQAEDLQITVWRLESKIDQLAAEKKSGLDQADRRQAHSAPNFRFRESHES